MATYFEKRSKYPYYKYVRMLLGVLSYNAKSICDVGSNGVDLISWLPCKEKVSIDLRNPFSGKGVEGIKANFITCDFQKKFDIVTCFQVMEHIKDDQIYAFANKLLAVAEKLLIVSVPYMWAKGACKYHVQDPVDESKFLSWFDISPETPLKPVFSRIIYSVKNSSSDERTIGRLVVVFASSKIADALDELNEESNWLIRYS